jgi:hypothetical protein
MSKVVVCRVVLLTLVLVAVFATHASAFTEPTCFKDVVKCFEDSANLPFSWDRTWYALDCELSFVGCVRIAIFGL